MNVNLSILVGRVSKDPEIKKTNAGKSVVSFSLATNQEWKNKDGAKTSKTEWHNLVFWDKLAEIVGAYVVKGQEIFVLGKIQYRKYTDKAGNERTATDIIVRDLQMGTKPNREHEHPVPTNETEEIPPMPTEEEMQGDPTGQGEEMPPF